MSHRVVTPAQSESVVTAKFFATKLQNQFATGAFTTGAVCIDIGGETSDISIWQNDDLYWQTSLRFAGRHIFLNLLKANPKILNKFGADNGDIELLEKASTDKFYAHADALIQDKGQKWLDKLATVSDEHTIQPFIQLISLGVAGLLYYVGLLLNYLSHSPTNFSPEIPSIYIGGNGSKILDWIAAGRFNHDTIASRCRKHLKHVIRDASGFVNDNKHGIETSQAPKEEAAYGLVAEGTKLTLNRPQFDTLAGETFIEDEIGCEWTEITLAGETFIEDGIRHKWTEILTAKRLGNRLSVPMNNLDQIHNFIESFNTTLGTEINMPVDLNETLSGETHSSATVRTVIYGELEKKLQGYSDTEDSEDISVEPLFILALKSLLNVKTRRWKNIGE